MREMKVRGEEFKPNSPVVNGSSEGFRHQFPVISHVATNVMFVSELIG